MCFASCATSRSSREPHFIRRNALRLLTPYIIAPYAGCETPGTLFFDVARIIETKRPRAFLLENVKNLVSHDKGRTFDVIRRTLTEVLGYARLQIIFSSGSCTDG